MTVTLTARPNGNAVESLSLNAAAATVASGAGLTVSYTASTGVLLITGTASTATYQTILQGILYNNTSDQPTTSNRSITVVARDSTNASSTSRTATITVTAVNDAPTIASLSGDSRAYSEGAGAVVIESGNAVVADVDSTNFDTGTLTVSIPAGGDSAEDVLSIRNQGTGAGQIGVSGSTVTYGGVTIGTFTGGSSGSNLVITLNSSATPTAVTALVRNITYQNTDTNAPTTGARTVRFVLTDGDGGTSPNYDTTVTVSAVNDAPVLADTALSLTVAEDAGVPSGAVGSLISTFTGGITDVDSGASKGLAITGSNQTNGIWYYTRNGGTTWTAVGHGEQHLGAAAGGQRQHAAVFCAQCQLQRDEYGGPDGAGVGSDQWHGGDEGEHGEQWRDDRLLECDRYRGCHGDGRQRCADDCEPQRGQPGVQRGGRGGGD